LSEIKTIEKYAENYIPRTEPQKLTIDTTIIAANALKALKNERFRGVKSANPPKQQLEPLAYS
jgi:Holliday junction resolvasome RuvABC endonuclease subunit